MNKIFLIAEIGINHNGDIKLAKKLIEMAISCGFDAVKFQKRTVEEVYSKEILDQFRESPWGTTQREQKFGLEFEEEEYNEIDKFCKNKIEWFASAWDVKSLNFLDQYKLKYAKVASAMIVDLNFLDQLSKRGKYTFISTGMSSIDDIDKAVEIFKKNNCPFELMHCISTYPMNIEDANLMTIPALKKRYTCKVGYSGHESGLAVSYAAVGLGISSLERHITIDRSMYGSDQSASLETSGARELVSVVRRMEMALGENKLGDILEDEIKIAKKLRAHIKN
jgi:N-acetylneuraminate synthase